MASIVGTNNTDFLNFQGDMQHLTITLINPYSGDLIEVDADFLVNSTTYDGQGGFDYLMMSGFGDAIFLDGYGSDPTSTSPTIQNVEFIIGGNGGDVINLASVLNNLNDILIDGGSGNDIIWSNQGDDILSGHQGNDHMVGGAGDDHIKGHQDDDYLNGGAGADLLDGGTENDHLRYSADAEFSTGLYAGKNQSYDTFRGGEGYDLLSMGDGDDVLLIHDSDALQHRSADSQNRISGIEDIKAGAGDDVIDLQIESYSYNQSVNLYGEDGNDFLESGNANDQLLGGNGNDLLYGGAGDDILYGGNNDGEIITEQHLFSDSAAFPFLNERVNIKKLLSPGDPALGITEGDLSVAYKTTATFTFQQSGAGYRNTLGFYRINHENGEIEGVEVGFANVKDYKPGTGYTVDLPGKPDTDFGFFIIANGYRHNRSYNDLDIQGDHLQFIYDLGGENERPATIYDDGDLISLIYDDGSTFKVLKGNVYHTTARGGSTELNRDEADHVVSGLIDPEDQTVLRIGFEDLKNLGDADYNDVVFDLEIAPREIDTSEQGSDTLIGGAGNDQLYGEGGNDLLIIGEGADIAYGGSGQDIFKFDYLDQNIDIISDFGVMGDADIIDISNLLSNYDALSQSIDDFVRLTTNETGDSILEINDGESFKAIAQIAGGLDGKSLTELIDQGQIIVENNL